MKSLLLVDHPVVEEDDLELVIEEQEGVQQVRLGPDATLVDPRLRVLEGPEHVVDVDVDAGRHDGKHAGDQVVRVAARLDDV